MGRGAVIYESAALPNFKPYSWANQYFSEEDQLKISYYDFIGWRRKPFSGDYITINEKGFRLNSSGANGDINNAKFWFFGGSTIWGSGSKDDVTIPSYFEKIANVPTFNFGEGAYISHQSLNLLVKTYAEYPKKSGQYIIFYDGVNDVAHKCRADHTFFSTEQEPLFSAYINKAKEAGSQSKTFSALSTTAGLFTTILTRMRYGSVNNGNPSTDVIYDCDTRPEKADQIARAFVLDWKLAKLLAESHGDRFLPILQPVSYIGSPNLSHLQAVARNQSLKNQYKTIYPKIKKILAESKIDYLDLTDAFDGDELFYFDFCHVTPNGNQLIAEKLNRYLLSQNRLVMR